MQSMISRLVFDSGMPIAKELFLSETQLGSVMRMKMLQVTQ